MSDMAPPEGGDPGARRPNMGLTIPRVLFVYGLMAALSWALSAWVLDGPPWRTAAGAGPAWMAVLAGAGTGLAVVAVDRVSETFIPLFREMAAVIRSMIGTISTRDAAVFAGASALAEELLFRGVLMPWLGLIASSVLFGLLHTAPDRRLWPWPLLAMAMGFALGGIVLATGNLLASIVAHFTINYFAFMRLASSEMTAGT